MSSTMKAPDNHDSLRLAQAQPLSREEILTIRHDFPVLQRTFYGKSLVYLDNGATTQKPQCVIDAITKFYSEDYGTVRRGVYALAEGSTAAFDASRETVRQFINANSSDEIVFVRGCTEAINLVAHSYGRAHLKAGDEILITAMEHHANIVPWQLLCKEIGCVLRVVPMDERGVLDLAAFEAMLSEKVKLLSIIHVANSLGTVNPVKEMTAKAHEFGAKVLVDGAQSAPHMAVDVQDLDCDWFCFSGHKLYGPTGVGVLYGKYAVLDSMIPYQAGGDMIDKVSFEETTFMAPPRRFEAGTPAIAQVVGLKPALDYMMKIGMGRIAASEEALLNYATQELESVPGLRIVGTAPKKAGVISFLMDSAHPLDIGTLVDHDAVAIRTGHHCAQPVMRHFDIPATARASFGIYNTTEDIDRLVQALHRVNEMCG